MSSSAVGDRPRQTDCVMLEMLRNVLDILQKNKTFRAELDRKYRARALETHLKSVPVLSSMPQDFIEYLRDRVELTRFSPGEVIVRQGDAADAFYLVRLGFVKVSERHPGGDVVLTTGRGTFFGRWASSVAACAGTCTALDHGRGQNRRRGLPPDAGAIPDIREGLELGGARARGHEPAAGLRDRARRSPTS
jgi:hypothetical protein